MPSDIILSVKLLPLSAKFIVLDRAQAESEAACPNEGAVCCFIVKNSLKGPLYRIGKSPEPWCRYCEVEVETPIHLVETCSLLTPLRIEIFEDYTPSLRDIINNRTSFQLFQKIGYSILIGMQARSSHP